jgi:hypothetical protein
LKRGRPAIEYGRESFDDLGDFDAEFKLALSFTRQGRGLKRVRPAIEYGRESFDDLGDFDAEFVLALSFTR